MTWNPDDVDAVRAAWAQVDGADGADLAVVQAHGHPHADTAELTGLDDAGGTWAVHDENGTRDVRIAWRAGPVDDPADLLAALGALRDVAASALRWSHAMGEHGMLRYSGPVSSA